MELVENNTMTNKDVLKKEKEYLNNIKPKYKEIYGDKGVQFCEDENKNENKIIKKEENKINKNNEKKKNKKNKKEKKG